MATKKPTRKPSGRPRLEGARRETFCVRLTQDELEALERAAEAKGEAVRVWAREALLRAARRVKD